MVREEFENWYQHYPRKVSRGAAEGPFGKARVDGGVSLEILIEATKHYAAQMAGQEAQFIRAPVDVAEREVLARRAEPAVSDRAHMVAKAPHRRKREGRAIW